MKATAVAPANIAFIKYWGQKDKANFLPYNGSISMNLNNCLSRTTAEFTDDLAEDEVMIAFDTKEFKQLSPKDGDKSALIFSQINRIRQLAGIQQKVRMKSKNNFPSNCGIASSASGFAALTLALVKASGLAINSKKELSKLTRLAGSVSAMRSIDDGYTEAVLNANECFAEQIADENHWALVDIVAITSSDNKKVSSTAGHLVAETSPYWQERLAALPARLKACKKAILDKNLTILGELIEEDCLSMHKVIQSSLPPINYWNKGTKDVTAAVKQLRKEGLKAYFTIDAGPNVHVICYEADQVEIKKRLNSMGEVISTITNKPSKGAHLSPNHLF